MVSERKKEDPFIAAIDTLIARKSVVLIGFLSVIAVSTLVVCLMPPRFGSRAKLQVVPPAIPRVEAPYLNEIGSRSFLENQKEFVKSRVVMEAVVNKFQLHTQPEPGLIHDVKQVIKRLLGKADTVADPLETALADLDTQVGAYYLKGTNILVIEAAANTAGGAATLANTVAEVFVESATRMLQSKTNLAYQYIEELVKQAQEKAGKSAAELNAFKKQYNILSSSEENSIVLRQISELDAQIKTTDMQIAMLENDLRAVNTDSGLRRENAEPAPTPVEAEREEISRLLKDIDRLKSDMALAELTLKGNHPDIRVLKNKIAVLDKKLDEERSKPATSQPKAAPRNDAPIQSIRNEIGKHRNIRASLVDQRQKIMRQRDSLALIQSKLDQLTRTSDADAKSHQALQEKLQEAKILQPNDRNDGQIRIIEAAFPPLASDKKLVLVIMVVSAIIGVIFGIGMAFTLEYFDDSFKTPDELEAILGVQVIGIIPPITKQTLGA
jgi:succinoglycan biosynthesis transport protein ExoP